MGDFLFNFLISVILNPLVIFILALVAAISFAANSSMKISTRIPMTIILLYFSTIYLYIFFVNDISVNQIIVRIGLIFLLVNISVGNLLWIFYFKKRIAKFTLHNRRVGDKK